MQAQIVARPKRVPDNPPTQKTILIVEDDAADREVLSHRLGKQGYRTIAADTGEKGLTLARTERPSLALLDLQLPDVDGFSVCQRLDEDEATGHIPVIVVSGMDGRDVLRRARKAGCTYFVHKPYDPNALLILVQQAIRDAEEF
jgi:CheY-like chemotaxis protein